MNFRNTTLIVCLLGISIFSLSTGSQAIEIWGLMTSPTPGDEAQIVTFDSVTPETFNVIGPTGIGLSSFQSGLDFDGGGNLFMTTHATTDFLYSVNGRHWCIFAYRK